MSKEIDIDDQTEEFINDIIAEMLDCVDDFKKALKKRNGMRMLTSINSIHFHVDGLMNGVKQSLAPPPQIPEGALGIPVTPDMIERLGGDFAKMIQQQAQAAHGSPEPSATATPGQYL